MLRARLIHAELLRAAARRNPGEPPVDVEDLEDVARLAAGLRTKEIATQLFLSERTVESHVSVVLDTLGSPRRMGIHGLLPAEGGWFARSVLVDLTSRQREVGQLVAEGLTNSHIAERLGLSSKTIEKHVRDLFERLGVHSRSAVAAALRDG